MKSVVKAKQTAQCTPDLKNIVYGSAQRKEELILFRKTTKPEQQQKIYDASGLNGYFGKTIKTMIHAKSKFVVPYTALRDSQLIDITRHLTYNLKRWVKWVHFYMPGGFTFDRR